ncbi:MAG: hypothetical protein AAGA75_15240 [Cyanobacteria bacterium P01_E01_bin.6]
MTAVITLPHNQVVLQSVSWTTYESLIHDLEAEPGKRLTYDRGTLEIMMPLPPHKGYKRLIGRLVETTTEEIGTEIRSLMRQPGGGKTCKKDLKRMNVITSNMSRQCEGNQRLT